MKDFLKKITKSPNLLPLVLVIFFAVLASRQLFRPGYFNIHDDLQMMRQLEVEKCILDGQIPCRWIPDMGYGFGFPLFNFYPPLPYLVGQVVRFFGFTFVSTVKILFVIAFIFSGITMYFLAKKFFGRMGGILSAFFYIWAPYHSVDIYVRGAMNEAWALIWFPAILLFSYKLIIDKRNSSKIFLGLSLSWFTLLMSHNLMVLIFSPVFAGWCLIWIIKYRKITCIKNLVLSGLLALGLAAFFTLPAIAEQKYVQVNTLVQGYYEFIAHLASLNQLLISRFWGYGPSIWGDNDGMPFQIGHLHWILSIFLGILLVSKILKTRRIDSFLLSLFYFLLIGWFSLFMAHSRSTPIWQAIPPLKFVQFPWRFLTITTLSFSFIAGSVVVFLKKYRLLLTSVLVASALVLNWSYFRPEKIGPLTDEEKFTGAAWELQQTAGIYDYLPVWAREAPKEPAKIGAEYLKGGRVYGIKQGTNRISFKIDGDGGVVRINTFYFPDWKVFVDGSQVPTFINDDKWGRIHLTVRPGEHFVEAKLFDTPVRKIGNLISFASWIWLGIFFVKRKSK